MLDKKYNELILTISIGIFIGCIASILGHIYTFIILIGFIGAIYTFINPKNMLLIVLLVRPTLDILNNTKMAGLSPAAFIGIIPIILLFKLIINKDIKKLTKFEEKFFVFIIISIFSTIIGIINLENTYLMIGINEVLKLLSLISIVILVSLFCKEEKQYSNEILNTIMYSAVIPLIYGVYQYIFLKPTLYNDPPDVARIRSVFVHPNPYAFYLVIIIVISYIVMKSNKSVSIDKIIIFVASFIQLYLTYTRGAWLGIGIFFIGEFLYGFKKSSYIKKTIITIIFIFSLPFIMVNLNNLLGSRFEGILSSKMEESSLATRLYIWSNMIPLIKDQVLIGHGLSTFKIYSASKINWAIEAHNDYIKLLFEQGIVGLIVYLNFIFYIIKHLFKHYREDNLIRCALNIFVIFSLMSLGDNLIDMLVTQIYIYALLAISMITIKQKIDKSI